jgi:fructose-1,6-bisphosphatase
MTRVAAEKDLQKEITDSLSEKYGISKRLLTKIAKVYYTDTYKEEIQKNQEFEESYDCVSGTVV